jgi:hypothetical protein
MRIIWKTPTTINSVEYLELKDLINKVKLSVTSLELDLQLYVKRLRASKGLGKKDADEDNENFNNPIILPT